MDIEVKENIKLVLANLPNKPGVYRYYDQAGNLLYVGKAKNLKKRVTSYFQDSKIQTERMTLLLRQMDRIEYSIVKTEKESLILEANLIHSLQPKFNILLKNDASYVYVCKSDDLIPSFFVTRRKYNPRAKYFGPYTKTYAINDVLRTLRIIFPYCQQKVIGTKPCDYVALKQCNGICIGEEDIEEYNKRLTYIEKILDGKTNEVELVLKQKMQDAINIENYELAGLWRDKINLLKDTVSDQKAILQHEIDIDLLTLIISIETDGLLIGSIYLQNIRSGKMINVNNYILSGINDLEIDEIKNKKTTNEDIEKDVNFNNIANSFIIRFLSSYENKGVSMYIQAFMAD